MTTYNPPISERDTEELIAIAKKLLYKLTKK